MINLRNTQPIYEILSCDTNLEPVDKMQLCHRICRGLKLFSCSIGAALAQEVKQALYLGGCCFYSTSPICMFKYLDGCPMV